MSFLTKLDYSNNRQIKQFELTSTQLSGTTVFGVPDEYIPENFSADTININALQNIQTIGLIFPEVIPTFTGVTYQLLGRDNSTGKIVEVPSLSGGTGSTLQIVTDLGNETTNDIIVGDSTFAQPSTTIGDNYISFTESGFDSTLKAAYSGITFNNSNSGVHKILHGTAAGTTHSVKLPDAPSSDTLVVSVNNTFADNAGNITLSVGSVNTDDYTITAELSGETLEFTRLSGGTYDVVLTGFTNTGLEVLNEGNGDGWRLIGRNAANYGNIGLNAIDFSVSTSASSTRGSTGQKSVTFGTNSDNPYISTMMSGLNLIGESTNGYSGENMIAGSDIFLYNNLYGNLISGFENIIGTSGATLNQAVVYNSIISGWNTDVRAGKDVLVVGQGLRSGSAAVGIVGNGNIDLTQTVATQLTSTGQAYNPRFIVGTGSWNSDSDTGSRANGLVVMSDGVVSAPSLSIADIDSPTVPTGASASFGDRVLVTKEWVNTNFSGGTGSNTDDYAITAELSGDTLNFTRLSGGTYDVVLTGFTNSATKTLQIQVFTRGSAVTTGYSADDVIIPSCMDGFELVNVVATVEQKGVFGTTDVQIERFRTGFITMMLSTKVTIGDVYFSENGIVEVGVERIVNTGDKVRVEVTAIPAGTAPDGLNVVMEFRAP